MHGTRGEKVRVHNVSLLELHVKLFMGLELTIR